MPSLVRLACPQCGGELPAPADTVLFACPACGHASGLVGGRLATASNAVVPPRRGASGDLAGHYPCWLFPTLWDGAATAAASATPGAPDGRPHWRLPPTVAIPSLAPESGGAYLRLARALSLTTEPLVGAAGPPRGSGGGQLDAADARRLLPTVALGCVPSALRRRLLESDAPPLRAGPPALVWLPFARAGGRLRDLVCDVEVTDRLLGDAPAAAGPGADRATAAAERAAAPPPVRGNGAASDFSSPEPAGAGRGR